MGKKLTDGDLQIDEEVILSDEDLEIPDHTRIQNAAAKWVEKLIAYNSEKELAEMNLKLNPEASERHAKSALEHKKALAGYKRKYGDSIVIEGQRQMGINNYIRSQQLKELGL